MKRASELIEEKEDGVREEGRWMIRTLTAPGDSNQIV
jgi:hypothetical protein